MSTMKPSDVRLLALADHLRQAGLTEAEVRVFVSAPTLLAEHERTFAQLVRINSLLQHVGRSQPLALELDSALKGTVKALQHANGRLSVSHLRALVNLTPEAFDACLPTIEDLLAAQTPT